MAIFLKPDGEYEITVGATVLTVKEKIIPDSARAPKYVASYVRKGDPMKPLKMLGEGTGRMRGVVIHNTNEIVTSPETNPAEQYTRATWPNGNMGGAVVHFYVWNREIWQNLALTERGWHAGDGSGRRKDKLGTGMVGGNADCVGIECIGGGEESIRTTALLAAWLLKQAGLTVEEGLYPHRYFKPEKNCPEFILPHWEAFEAKVRQYMGAEKEEMGAEKEEMPEKQFSTFPPCPYLGRSIVDALKSLKVKSDFAYRKEIALANGISNYKGLASQNSLLLRLLKAGELKKPKKTT